MRHDIHIQHHVIGRIDAHHHILAIRYCGLQHTFVGYPVGIAEMFRINDVFTLRPPMVVAVDNGFNIMVEEVKIVVFQL